MSYVVSLMEPHCDAIDVDPGGVDDCINVKLTVPQHFSVVNIEETSSTVPKPSHPLSQSL